MPSLTNKSYRFAFILITSLFFLWGFAHNLDPILIPHLKKSFTLTTTQATLIDSAVFIGYFLMALPAGFIIKKYGYKAGIITGLLFFAAGCFLFLPAADTQQYSFFLIALFIIACGLTILETAANPYAAVLGDPETSTQRLNFSQSFNGLAAFVAPFVGAWLIFTKDYTATELSAMTESARKIALASEASSVKVPYFILGVVLILVAVLFVFIKLPVIQHKDNNQAKGKSVFHALRHNHLAWGVVAQFFYVGAQVCIFSLFILYATESAGITKTEAAYYLGICGLAFLIGRFFGTFLMGYIRPERLLAIYAGINIVLCIVAITASGMVTIYTVIGTCFFMSIMFPTIFSLGIRDIGGDTEYGSSLLIMSIVGGAILPPVFGYISDFTGDIRKGYIVPLICFAVILYYGLKGFKVKQTGKLMSSHG